MGTGARGLVVSDTRYVYFHVEVSPDQMVGIAHEDAINNLKAWIAAIEAHPESDIVITLKADGGYEMGDLGGYAEQERRKAGLS